MGLDSEDFREAAGKLPIYWNLRLMVVESIFVNVLGSFEVFVVDANLNLNFLRINDFPCSLVSLPKVWVDVSSRMNILH